MEAKSDLSNNPVGWQWAPGANIYAYVRGEFGLAESARLYAKALIDAGYPLAILDLDLDVPHSLGDSSLVRWITTESQYPIDIVFVNPDYFAEALVHMQPAGEVIERYRIGCWFWELERFPDEWLRALADVDEVMVASDFVARGIRAVTDKPVTCIPLPVGDAADSGLERVDFGMSEDAFVFLCTFDFNSFVSRKNPLAVVSAFRQAFGSGHEKVQLFVKSSNGHRHPRLLAALVEAAGGDPRITVRDEVIEREHVHALQRCCDAYVSLHRAEGFGLGMAECMRLGKPVIATAYSGNLEFMNESNSFLVRYRMVRVRQGEYPHAQGQVWAEPDIGHAAELFRSVVADPIGARSIGERARSHMLEQFSPEVCSRAIAARLDVVVRPAGNERLSMEAPS